LRKLTAAVLVYSILLTLMFVLPTAEPKSPWEIGLGFLLLLALPPLTIVVIVAAFRHWRGLRWLALSPLVCLGLGLGVSWFVPRHVWGQRRLAFERVLPQYERTIHEAVSTGSTRVIIDPATLPRPGNYCCVRVWASRAANGQVSAVLLISRNAHYVYSGERPPADSTRDVRAVAPGWWLVSDD
jgi:hypothetical protein